MCNCGTLCLFYISNDTHHDLQCNLCKDRILRYSIEEKKDCVILVWVDSKETFEIPYRLALFTSLYLSDVAMMKKLTWCMNK